MVENERTIQEITQRLVAFYRPVRVYLLGPSWVRRAG